MAADMVRGLRAYQFTPVNDGSEFFKFFGGTTCYALALDSASKNISPISYSPSVCCYGESKEQALSEICKWMGSITNGMIQSPQGYIKPQKWVSAWEEALTNPNEMRGMSWQYYKPTAFTAEEGFTISEPLAEIKRQTFLNSQFKTITQTIMSDDSWAYFYNKVLEIVQRPIRYTTNHNEIYLLLYLKELIDDDKIVANFQFYLSV